MRARSGDILRACRRIVPTRSRRISIALREPRRGGERDASCRAKTLLRRRYERASRVAVRAGTRRRLRRPRESSLFRHSDSTRLRPSFLVLSRNSLVPPKRARRGVRSGPGRGFGSRRVVHSPRGSGSGSVRQRSASRALVEEASPTVLHRVEFRASTRFFRATKFRGVRAFHRARVDGRTTGGDGTGVGGESRGERRVYPSTRFVDWRFRRRIVGDGGGERRRGEECVRTPGTRTGMGTGMGAGDGDGDGDDSRPGRAPTPSPDVPYPGPGRGRGGGLRPLRRVPGAYSSPAAFASTRPGTNTPPGPGSCPRRARISGRSI